MDLAKELEPEVSAEEIAAAEQPTEPPKEEPAEKHEEREQKLVPHQALHEEREKRKQFQRELEEERRRTAAQMAVLNDRFQQVYQVASQKQQPQREFRDPNADPDPLAALAHNQHLTQQELAELRRQRSEESARNEQAAKEAQYATQLAAWGASRADEFRSEAPDFDAAYDHIRLVRAKELHAMGYSGPEIQQNLRLDELRVLHNAAQAGRNPAEIMYRMAEATGYKKKDTKAPAEEKIETLQKGTQAAKSLGNGSAQAGMPTPEQIAAMGDDEFDRFLTDLRKSGKSLSDVI